MVLRILAVVALLCTVARADAKPWAQGVPEADQQAALEIYQQANELFEQSQYKPALELYERALARWKHPAIYYNAAVCLINLDRPVEAYEYLELALAYDEAPLGSELYRQGLTYRKMLGNQLAELEIVLNEPGAAVSLDGKPLFEAPGKAARRVRTGEPHQVVARKSGYETETRLVRLQPGQRTTLVLEMKLLERSKTKPAAVAVVGAVIAAAGAGMLVKAYDDYDRYEAEVAKQCPMGCTSEAALGDAAGLDERGRKLTIGAYSAIAVGGVTMAIGAYFFFRNSGKPTITPTATRDRAGVAVTFPW